METVIDRVLKKIEDVRAIAIRATSRISKAETSIESVKKNISYASGVATINDTMAGADSGHFVTWFRFGRIVVVTLYAIHVTTNVTSSWDCVIASGLPKAKANTPGTIQAPGQWYQYQYPIAAIEGTGTINWWFPNTVDAESAGLIGQLIYETEEEEE